MGTLRFIHIRELAAIIGFVGLLILMRFLGTLPWDTTFRLGWATIAAGFSTGIPLMIAYHISLKRYLIKQEIEDPDWVKHPIRYNGQLRETKTYTTLALCYTAASGFFVILLGVAMVAASIWFGYLQVWLT